MPSPDLTATRTNRQTLNLALTETGPVYNNATTPLRCHARVTGCSDGTGCSDLGTIEPRAITSNSTCVDGIWRMFSEFFGFHVVLTLHVGHPWSPSDELLTSGKKLSLWLLTSNLVGDKQ